MIVIDEKGDILIEALVHSPFAHFPTVQRVNVSHHLREIVRQELKHLAKAAAPEGSQS